jgi:cation transporter-like permease
VDCGEELRVVEVQTGREEVQAFEGSLGVGLAARTAAGLHLGRRETVPQLSLVFLEFTLQPAQAEIFPILSR